MTTFPPHLKKLVISDPESDQKIPEGVEKLTILSYMTTICPAIPKSVKDLKIFGSGDFVIDTKLPETIEFLELRVVDLKGKLCEKGSLTTLKFPW